VHTSAYVCIRLHTSAAYVSAGKRAGGGEARVHTSAYVCIRQQTSAAYVSAGKRAGGGEARVLAVGVRTIALRYSAERWCIALSASLL
jgi:hypothetical protein